MIARGLALNTCRTKRDHCTPADCIVYIMGNWRRLFLIDFPSVKFHRRPKTRYIALELNRKSRRSHALENSPILPPHPGPKGARKPEQKP